jgi:hypothetical protein
MTTVREFRIEDVSQVVALHGRVFGVNPVRRPQWLAGYFEEVLLKNPWHDASLPSLVSTENGRITGFLGVMPRPMTLRGHSVRAAVCAHFMVDPRHHIDLAAVRLLKAFLSGPQDLSLSDGANSDARRMWLALGGTAPPLYSLRWMRLLRPARYLLSHLGQPATRLQPLIRMSRPLAAAFDAVSARLPRNRLKENDTGLTEEPLQPATMFDHLPEVMRGTTLQPAYDARALAWLLDQAALTTRHGRLRARAVLNGARLLGWYIYYQKPQAPAEVVQLAAREGAFERVVRRFLSDAWRNGATVARGRLEPRFIQALSEHSCWFRQDNTWTLAHSRDQDLLAALHQGSVFLSRLEGEWWMRFLDESENES